jgi:GT2 family glycosyltransferase
MRISVVVATYNRSALLRESLEHLRRQQYEPGDEVIVVDNASTDDTAALLAGAAQGFPVPLRGLRETEPGKTAALNTGIRAAQGAILALTDDDVLVADNWIATIRELFREGELALVGGRVDPRWESSGAPAWLRIERNGHYTRMTSPLALQHYGPRQALGARTAVGANMVVRRDVVLALGGFSANLGRLRGTLMCGEDHEFCQRLVGAGYRAVYDPTLTVRHWVPAERARLRYYLRWFFWSGVTNATLDGPVSTGARFLSTPRYIWGQLLRGAVSAARSIIRGDRVDAASALMETAFATGYIWQELRGRSGWQETSSERQQAPQLPAPPQSPALPIPGVETGKLDAMKATEPQQREGQPLPGRAMLETAAISRFPADDRGTARNGGM